MAGDFDIGPADWVADELTRQSQELGLYQTGDSMNGKGDTPRPIVVDQETYKKNWEQTFPKPQETLGDPEE